MVGSLILPKMSIIMNHDKVKLDIEDHLLWLNEHGNKVKIHYMDEGNDFLRFEIYIEYKKRRNLSFYGDDFILGRDADFKLVEYADELKYMGVELTKVCRRLNKKYNIRLSNLEMSSDTQLMFRMTIKQK